MNFQMKLVVNRAQKGTGSSVWRLVTGKPQVDTIKFQNLRGKHDDSRNVLEWNHLKEGFVLLARNK